MALDKTGRETTYMCVSWIIVASRAYQALWLWLRHFLYLTYQKLHRPESGTMNLSPLGFLPFVLHNFDCILMTSQQQGFQDLTIQARNLSSSGIYNALRLHFIPKFYLFTNNSRIEYDSWGYYWLETGTAHSFPIFLLYFFSEEGW